MREDHTARDVSCLLRPELHHEGAHAANFVHDVEVMLEQGEHYGLAERDEAFLIHSLRCCVRNSPNASEGFEVSMSSRQWGTFVAIRRSFMRARRNPQNLLSHLSNNFRVRTPNTEINP